MAECHLCGRATVGDDTGLDPEFGGPLPLNICHRAGCDPERSYLLERTAGERMDHWPILTRFKRKAEAGA